MRIAIVTECYVPEVNGVVYHIETLRKGLIEEGHEVLIVKPDFNVKKHFIKDNILYSPAVKLKKLYDYSISYPYSKTRLKLLKEWNPDVIHIHTEFSQGVFALYAGKKLNIPIVYTIHTMYYDYLHYLGKLKDLKAIKKAVNWGILRYTETAKAVICASTKMENFLKFCKVTTPIYKIPNACITSDFAEETLDENLMQNLKREYNINSEDLNLCFCGRIAEEKNLSLMLKYWKEIITEIPKGRLFIIGDGPSKNELELKSQELKIDDSVIFTGKISHELIKYYYHLCDAYIMTSLSENHSVSALEAIACGLPIIHAYDQANEEQYIKGLTGFAFNNSNELIEIIHTIYAKNHNSPKGQGLKEQIRKHAITEDYKAMTTKILNIYKRAISENI
ncbi:glycosyltransferase [Treponema denticola]|uniref:glycosyltransferase n=1 Tax=Treponema denticola TaxID=158 RepID=UPI0021063FC6|nr:glycosyltransferase [Treponema denticola]UTY26328.1 glycosyltransferase family 4 protein [Treponema denticola]